MQRMMPMIPKVTDGPFAEAKSDFPADVQEVAAKLPEMQARPGQHNDAALHAEAGDS